MFFDKNRQFMEESLENIRKDSLTPEQLKAEEEREKATKKSFQEEKFTLKDIVAMTIAVFSIVLPPLLIILAGISLVLLWFLR